MLNKKNLKYIRERFARRSRLELGVGDFFVCTVYYFVKFRNRNNSKFVHSKELEDVWRVALTSLFFFLAFTVAVITN